MIIAQLTDLHLREDGKPCHGVADSTANLKSAVERVRGLDPQPSVVLLTGDLTDHGSEAEYRNLAECIDRLTIPVYLIPGNHDDRGNLRAVMADHDYLPREGTFLSYVVEGFPVRLIGLDTTIPGLIGGRVCADRLRWLDERLGEEPEQPTLVFMHHPPLRCGIAGLDSSPFEGADEMERVVAGHPQVERIISGHVHRAMVRRFGGSVLTTSPSTAYPFHCDLSPNALLKVALEPIGYQLHVWSRETGLVTHTQCIDDYGVPVVLRDE